jgi:phosphoribosylglycinamide formyltransferase-1
MVLNIGVLASHRGTVLQAVLDASAQGKLSASVVVVISNNSDSGALERAARANVPCRHLSGKTHPDVLALDRAVAETLTGHRCELVLLAGYMKKLGPVTLTRFRGRILNTHPSLLPRHGGLNMYGQKVHAAVLQARDQVTGVTIHLVESDYDTGPIIAQREVPVSADDSVESLSARVASVESSFVVETLRRIATGELLLPSPTGSAG